MNSDNEQNFENENAATERNEHRPLHNAQPAEELIGGAARSNEIEPIGNVVIEPALSRSGARNVLVRFYEALHGKRRFPWTLPAVENDNVLVDQQNFGESVGDSRLVGVRRMFENILDIHLNIPPFLRGLFDGILMQDNRADGVLVENHAAARRMAIANLQQEFLDAMMFEEFVQNELQLNERFNEMDESVDDDDVEEYDSEELEALQHENALAIEPAEAAEAEHLRQIQAEFDAEDPDLNVVDYVAVEQQQQPVDFVEEEPELNASDYFEVAQQQQVADFVEEEPEPNASDYFEVAQQQQVADFVEEEPELNASDYFEVAGVQQVADFVEEEPELNASDYFEVAQQQQVADFVEEEPELNASDYFEVVEPQQAADFVAEEPQLNVADYTEAARREQTDSHVGANANELDVEAQQPNALSACRAESSSNFENSDSALEYDAAETGVSVANERSAAGIDDFELHFKESNGAGACQECDILIVPEKETDKPKFTMQEHTNSTAEYEVVKHLDKVPAFQASEHSELPDNFPTSEHSMGALGVTPSTEHATSGHAESLKDGEQLESASGHQIGGDTQMATENELESGFADEPLESTHDLVAMGELGKEKRKDDKEQEI